MKIRTSTLSRLPALGMRAQHLSNPPVVHSVDNMKDIGDLQKYVAESAVVLLFLSVGYVRGAAL